MAEIKESIVARLEAAAAKLGGGGGDDGEGAAPFVVAYQEYYAASVQPFIDASNKLEETKYVAEMTEKAWKHLGVLMEAVSECKKPQDQGKFMAFLQPIVDVITGSEAKVDNRSKDMTYQKSFAEVCQAHQWIMVELPAKHVAGQLDAADFYLNKVLKAAMDAEDQKKKDIRAWVASLKAMVKGMSEYVKDFHKTGPTWNFKGDEIYSWKPGQKKAAGGAGAASLEDRLEAAVKAIEAAANKKRGGGGDEKEEPEFVQDYDEFYATGVQPFIDACNALDETKYCAEMSEKAWKHLGLLMRASVASKKPQDQGKYMEFLKPIVDCITGSEAKVDNRSPAFPFQKSFAELAQAHQWIMVELPAKHVAGQLDAADFYLNKVLKAAMDADADKKAKMRAYVSTMKAMVKQMADYVKKYHKTGITWNGKGGEVWDFKVA